MDRSQHAVDALAAIAMGGPDAAGKVTEILSAIAKAPDPQALPADIHQQAIDALVAMAVGGPHAWRKATEVLAALAKMMSQPAPAAAPLPTGTARFH